MRTLLLHSIMWLLRLLLLGLSLMVLVSVVHFTSIQFDIFDAIQVRWMPFLGGEFVFSVLLPFGIHVLMASTGGSFLFSWIAFSILVGLVAAHFVAYRFTKTDEDISLVSKNFKYILGILVLITIHILVNYLMAEPGTSRATMNFKTPWLVRALVKIGAVLQIVTAIFVIAMGIFIFEPDDLLSKLIWEGFGYRYDLVVTFGEQETRDSFLFFYMILSTMLANIFQTACIGIWTLCLPVEDTSLALTCGVMGVPLIILANAIAMSIYGQQQEDARDCMIAHILLLVQTNVHTPIIWWVHQCWMARHASLAQQQDLKEKND